jgi:hypothetical protein
MITVVVHYGNHNKFSIDLPSNTELGCLAWYFSKIINKNPADILYLLMGGCVIGTKPREFNKTLAECNIINGKCVVSMVLSDPTITYPDSDLYICTRNLYWLHQHTVSAASAPAPNQAPASAPRESMNMENFLQAIGANITNFVDVPVTISEDEYEQYITHQPATQEDPCTICSHVIDENAVALACRHTFHNACLHEWLTTCSVKCPSCNQDVRT